MIELRIQYDLTNKNVELNRDIGGSSHSYTIKHVLMRFNGD